MDNSSVIYSSVIQFHFRRLCGFSQRSVVSSTIFIGVLLVMTAKAFAADMSAPTVEESRSMPVYCQVKLFQEGTPAAGIWYSNYPDGFGHIHHYCYGLAYLNRSYGSMPKSDKIYLRNNAVGQMDYVIGHAQPSFKLLSDVYYSRGQTLLLLNRKAEAMDNLNRSLKIDPTQMRPYLLLADAYVQVNQKIRALETVTEGLRYAPKSKGLLRRYKELGGKEPFPEPINKPEPQVEQEPQEKSTDNNTSVKPVDPPQVETQPASELPSAPNPNVVEPKIGSPANPYCRFCP